MSAPRDLAAGRKPSKRGLKGFENRTDLDPRKPKGKTIRAWAWFAYPQVKGTWAVRFIESGHVIAEGLTLKQAQDLEAAHNDPGTFTPGRKG